MGFQELLYIKTFTAWVSGCIYCMYLLFPCKIGKKREENNETGVIQSLKTGISQSHI